MRVINMTSPRTGAKVANQFMIEGDGGEYFQSYETTIGYISQAPNLLLVSDDYNYSKTTSKYFKQWLKEWGWDSADVDRLKKLLSGAQFGQKYGFTVGQSHYVVVLVSDVNSAIKYKMYQ